VASLAAASISIKGERREETEEDKATQNKVKRNERIKTMHTFRFVMVSFFSIL
jgi:hypothetical protein